MSAEDVNADRLRKITNELIDAISSPPFVEAMRRMKETPIDQRLEFARSSLRPKVLAEAGVRFPEGMRITSRYFESGIPGVIEVDDFGARAASITDSAAQFSDERMSAAWGCACGGAATVCGGAGGGS